MALECAPFVVSGLSKGLGQREYIRVMRQVLQTKPDSVKAQSTIGVGWAIPRTAALACDKIWAPPTSSVPADLRCWTATPMEIMLTLNCIMDLGEFSWGSLPSDLSRKMERLENQMMETHAKYSHWTGSHGMGGLPAGGPAFGSAACMKAIADAMRWEYLARATPVFDSHKSRRAAFSPGDEETLVASLSSLAIVDESALGWDVVSEFRKDPGARADYWQFLKWLDDEMTGQPAHIIQEVIEAKLVKYQRALRKHGITTILGVTAAMLGATSIPVVLQHINEQPLWVLVTEGVLVSGSVLATVAKDYVATRPDPPAEMAWVYEVKKLRSKGTRT